LVAALGRGEDAALAELHRRYAGALLALARRVVRDPTLAEEVVQEVFLRLWSAPDRFDPDRGSLRSFLVTNCHGRAVDVVRAEVSRRNREEREHRRATPAVVDTEDEVISITVTDEVRAALGTLPDGEREAVALAYVHGHSYREVAALLGQPEGTVKSRIRSGLRRLQSELRHLRGDGPT
jgi:RNA polymerase sigma-70 factor (ECF subfamily)